MDKLVAQYSRPPHQNEMYSEQEQQDLTASVPPLSLKFSLPPVDNVSLRWILLHILFDLDGGIVGGYTSILTSTQAAPSSQLCLRESLPGTLFLIETR